MGLPVIMLENYTIQLLLDLYVLFNNVKAVGRGSFHLGDF